MHIPGWLTVLLVHKSTVFLFPAHLVLYVNATSDSSKLMADGVDVVFRYMGVVRLGNVLHLKVISGLFCVIKCLVHATWSNQGRTGTT